MSLEQLSLPPVTHPGISPEQATKAIHDHLKGAELKGEPTWDWINNEWRALVAITPWGPLVVAGFCLSKRLVCEPGRLDAVYGLRRPDYSFTDECPALGADQDGTH